MTETPRARRLAAIDIGTNSVHMLVVEQQEDGYRVIDREKEMVQLGRGSLGGAPLTSSSMERAIRALQTMSTIARRWEVDDVAAVATSAVREAPNGEQFVQRVIAETGLRIRVIAGEEEADYIYRAVRAAVDFGDRTAFCIDIGGGSVELVVGTAQEVFLTASAPVGSLRLAQKFFDRNADGVAAIDECRRYVKRMLRRQLREIRSLRFELAIGTSGTINSLAEAGVTGGGAGLRWLVIGALDDLIARLAACPPAERAERFSIDPKRAETILPGAVALSEVMHSLSINRILSCGAALREGLVERWLDDVKTADSGSTGVRNTSVLALAERSRYDATHAAHVRHLALRLFDQLQPLHGLSPVERELLGHAATLHEIGVHVAWEGHHKHSYYLIRHGGLRGFTEEEIAMIAAAARFHRKSPPADDDSSLAELAPAERQATRRMIALLRIADGLDRGRRGAVADVSAVRRNGTVELRLELEDDATVEIESATRRARYFAKQFGVSVAIRG